MKKPHGSQKNKCQEPALRPIRVVLFCGGRGSATIIHEWLRHANVALTLVVNAYDDGLSTGALRDFIAQMLGPSDFRKNLSCLLDPYSESQYALKHLLEYRFPATQAETAIQALETWLQREKRKNLPEPLRALFGTLTPAIAARVRALLTVFFDYARCEASAFDYRDCALGNLIFAGAYLKNHYDFNAATREIAELACSRAMLVNVSEGENRILVGLKDNGEVLTSEAKIVGEQSEVPIRQFFFLEEKLDDAFLQSLEPLNVDEREQRLRALERLPRLSREAEEALRDADIILYGPGTQHSSLLPSYRIAGEVIAQAKAPVKALVLNLGPDHDIQSLSGECIVNNALACLGDMNNTHGVITHVFVDNNSIFGRTLQHQPEYRHAAIIAGNFANAYRQYVHNGHAIVAKVLAIWAKPTDDTLPQADMFVDIHKRSSGLGELYEEVLEADWRHYFSRVTLTLNHASIQEPVPGNLMEVREWSGKGAFPEVGYFLDWYQHRDSEYLIVVAGDGKYHIRDVLRAITLLEQSHYGAVFGSRNQSRAQFRASIRAAYGERRVLGTCSLWGSLLVSGIFAFRFGMVFSDPLTGFRVFKRRRLQAAIGEASLCRARTPVSLAAWLIQHNVEIAELPVNYRTYAGFADPRWRVRRGLKNLLSTFRR